MKKILALIAIAFSTAAMADDTTKCADMKNLPSNAQVENENLRADAEVFADVRTGYVFVKIGSDWKFVRQVDVRKARQIIAANM